MPRLHTCRSRDLRSPTPHMFRSCSTSILLFSGWFRFRAQEAKARGGEAWKAGDVDEAIVWFSKVGVEEEEGKCIRGDAEKIPGTGGSVAWGFAFSMPPWQGGFS